MANLPLASRLSPRSGRSTTGPFPVNAAVRPGGWCETRYEAKARKLGHEVWYFRYRRKGA
jgi:hypothetical protein